MDIEIQLGSPRHNCDRFGICHMETRSKSKYNIAENKALASLTLHTKNTFRLRFYTNQLLQSTYEKHFSNGFFKISVTAAPSGNVFKHLGISPFVIKVGDYPIKLTKCYVEIHLPYSLSEEQQEYVCACADTS